MTRVGKTYVKCLRGSQALPGSVFLQITRIFFKNIARSLLIYSGKSATVTQTVDTCKLEGFYESLNSDESLIQENN